MNWKCCRSCSSTEHTEFAFCSSTNRKESITNTNVIPSPSPPPLVPLIAFTSYRQINDGEVEFLVAKTIPMGLSVAVRTEPPIPSLEMFVEDLSIRIKGLPSNNAIVFYFHFVDRMGTKSSTDTLIGPFTLLAFPITPKLLRYEQRDPTILRFIFLSPPSQQGARIVAISDGKVYSTTTNMLDIEDLETSISYTFRFVEVIQTLESLPSESTPSILLLAPLSIPIIQSIIRNETRVRIKLMKGPEKQEEDIVVYDKEFGIESIIQFGSNETSISNLIRGQTYTFFAYTRQVGRRGKDSEPYTPSIYIPLTKPILLRSYLTPGLDRSITLRMDQSITNTSAFLVQQVNNNNAIVSSFQVKGFLIQIDHLLPGSSYQYRVAIQNSIETSLFSEPSISIIIPLTAPTLISPTIENETIRIQFLEAPLQGQTIEIQSIPSSQIFTSSTDSIQISLSSLNPGTLYRFYGQTKQDSLLSERSNYTDPSILTPLPIPIISSATLNNPFTVIVQLATPPPLGCVVTVQVEPTNQTFTSKTNIIRIAGLDPGRSYRFQARFSNALTQSAYSLFSQPIFIPTPITTITSPVLLQPVWIEDQKVRVSISISVYRIQIISIPDAIITTVEAGITSVIVDELSYGQTYQFVGIAFDSSNQYSAPSVLSPSVLVPIPKPFIQSIVSGDGDTAVVVMKEPAKPGTNYRALLDGDTQTSTDSSTLTLAGVIPGETYMLDVLSQNNSQLGQVEKSSQLLVVPPKQPIIKYVYPSLTDVSGVEVLFGSAPPVNTVYRVLIQPPILTDVLASSLSLSTSVSGLLIGQPYTFQARSERGTLTSAYSTPPYGPVLLPIQPPILLSATLVEGIQARILFQGNIPPGAVLEVESIPPSINQPAKAYIGDTSVFVTNLSYGTTYTFRARLRIDENRVSEYSNRTNSITTDLYPPQPVSATATSSTEVTLVFAEPPSMGTVFRVRSSPMETSLQNATSSTLVFSGLQPGTSYDFFSYTESTSGQQSIEVRFPVKIDVPPLPPQLLSIQPDELKAAKVLSVATTFPILFRINGLDTTTQASIGSTSTILTNLPTGITLTIDAVALYASTRSLPSNTLSFVVRFPPPIIQSVVLDTINRFSAIITLTKELPINGSFRYIGMSSPGGLIGTSTSGSMIRINDLSPNTSYTFQTFLADPNIQSIASIPSNPIKTPPASLIITNVSIEEYSAIILLSRPVPIDSNAIVTSNPDSLSGTAMGGSNTIRINGLQPLLSYTFQGYVQSGTNNSDPSNTFGPVLVPIAAPIILRAMIVGDNTTTVQVTFSNTPPTGGTFRVTSNPSTTTQIVLAQQTSILFQNLVRGTSYVFRAVASYPNNTSVVSNPSEQVFVNYETPQILSVIVIAPDKVEVTFASAPLPPSYYLVTSIPDSITATTTSTKAIVSGLTNGGSYRFSAVATNGTRSSPVSNTSDLVTMLTYDPPEFTSFLQRNAKSMNITFSRAPLPNTTYVLTTDPISQTYTINSNTTTITNLTNTSYKFLAYTQGSGGRSITTTSDRYGVTDISYAINISGELFQVRFLFTNTLPSPNIYRMRASNGVTYSGTSSNVSTDFSLIQGTNYTFDLSVSPTNTLIPLESSYSLTMPSRPIVTNISVSNNNTYVFTFSQAPPIGFEYVVEISNPSYNFIVASGKTTGTTPTIPSVIQYLTYRATPRAIGSTVSLSGLSTTGDFFTNVDIRRTQWQANVFPDGNAFYTVIFGENTSGIGYLVTFSPPDITEFIFINSERQFPQSLENIIIPYKAGSSMDLTVLVSQQKTYNVTFQATLNGKTGNPVTRTIKFPNP